MAARSQPVVTPLTRAAIFLVATVRPGGEGSVLDLFADLQALQRSIGFRRQESNLAVVAGVGSELWDRLYPGAPRPAELHPLAERRGDRHVAPSTPGDLLFHIRAQEEDLCFDLAAHVVQRLGAWTTVVDEVHGFKYFDVRDLLGFVDGTENPPPDEAPGAVSVGEEDPLFAGSSYVVVQKYVHDLAAWNALPVEEQERVIGRTKLDDIEFPDDVKAPDSHVAVNTIVDPDGTERQVLRDNMPFGEVGKGEFGTFYIAYAGTPSVPERMLDRMFLGDPPGTYDRILDFSTALTGSLFFVPTIDWLEDGPPEAAAADPASDTTPSPAPARPEDPSLGLHGLRSPRPQ